MSDPQSDGCVEDEAEEAFGGLVVSGCQSSAVFSFEKQRSTRFRSP